MQSRLILNSQQIAIITQRLCHQAIETHANFEQSVVIGLQPRGIFFSLPIVENLEKILGKKITYGQLDTTFHRDDFRRNNKIMLPEDTTINFEIEDKKVLLIDDVLFTGRTIRAGFDALLDFGRPQKVELMVLVNRRYSRQFPIEPDYCGIHVDTLENQRIVADLTANEVWLKHD